MKVGDKVEILDLDYYIESRISGLFVGNTGTVANIEANGVVGVYTDNAETNSDSTGLGWAFRPRALKVVE